MNIGPIIMAIVVTLSITWVLTEAFYNRQLDDCRRKNNVYRCEFVAVPKTGENNEPK